MSRLAPLDKALVAILVPLWVTCFALGVKSQIRGAGLLLVGVDRAAEARGYPSLNGEFSPSYSSDPLREAGLRAGDILIRLGDADLRGAGPLRFAALASERADLERGVADVVFERGGRRGGASLALLPVSALRVTLAISLALGAAVTFLLLRAKPTRFTRTLFHAGMCNAILYPVYAATRWEFYAWAAIATIGVALSLPLLIRAAQRFPPDVPPGTRWSRTWPWGFVAAGAFCLAMLLGEPRWGVLGMMATTGLGLALTLAVVTRNYRASDPVGRRQAKWLVFGVYCTTLPVILAVGLALARPDLGWVAVYSWWTYPVAAVFLVVAIVRFNFVDVDRVISATASYNILLVLVGTGALLGVPRIAKAGSGLVGVGSGAGEVALSLLLVGILVPAHRRLRPQIERLFFKERYAFDRGVAALLPTLSSCRDARELMERVGEGLCRLLRPEACVVYAPLEGTWVPVFAAGRAVPPAFGPAGPLIDALAERGTPIALDTAGRRPDRAPLGAFDRAALEALDAEVVVPVVRSGTLTAFVCLGPKRSGDVYTSTDLSHLASVAETVSRDLQRFDQEQVIRESRAMQEALRRYVPGAVAEQLSSGAEPSSGEREVTVLFVDLRGYTGFSEGRRAEEIFSTVNRYTETVSQIVHEHAGSVVEFNGDGMMAVFGAPRALAHKERAAVEAGRAIVAAVAALPVEPPPTQVREAVAQRDEAERSRPAGLSVGVGIATGEAFVGDIQAVDRRIWSAIGNTTNLAARLQGLTRDLDAALVIDGTTWQRAGAVAAGFEKRPGVAIRGRREAQDVYVLPLRPEPAYPGPGGRGRAPLPQVG